MSQPGRPRLDWFQDGFSVSIVIYEASVQPESVSVASSGSDLRVTYLRSDDTGGVGLSDDSVSRAPRVVVLRLFAPILDPLSPESGYKLECTKNKVELRFLKAVEGQWPSLEQKADREGSSLAAYSKIDERALEQELVTEAQPTSEEQFLQLLRDIYSKSDDDTKRAMEKSFSTSSGTVLSTDWKQVKDKDF
ncbi:SGS domain-containing protein, putative [Babesia caballi]|uniref:SGS domain-containing protein, putative n=1 Tax=Babesia caballi TaxID=5871 RepID=A0AAV4LW55_BABCB|nr:SGS domain-containing protein, putative [Babesia caballi]